MLCPSPGASVPVTGNLAFSPDAAGAFAPAAGRWGPSGSPPISRTDCVSSIKVVSSIRLKRPSVPHSANTYTCWTIRSPSRRADLDDAALFDLISALGWLREQLSHASRADHLFGVIASAILADRGRARRLERQGRRKGMATAARWGTLPSRLPGTTWRP